MQSCDEKKDLKTIAVKAADGMALKITTLKDLNATIDNLFSRIAAGEDQKLLEDLCPYFGNLWPAAQALTDHLAAMGDVWSGARVCEVGCGLALPSLYLAKRGATVVASDFHPDVPEFLKRNIELNKIPERHIIYVPTDWSALRSDKEHHSLLQHRPYNWVIGSDVLYENTHPETLARALSLLAGKGGRILIADPMRPYLQSFIDAMGALGYRNDTHVRQVPTDQGRKDIMLVFLY
jgi:predicted nicotinamide N-methyase